LVVLRDNDHRPDLVVCFITSIRRGGPDMAAIAATAGTGLKVPSLVRFDKLATLDRSVIAGKIGAAPVDWLHAHRAVFFGVFGFGQP
jgi:mRNA interferase MazF